MTAVPLFKTGPLSHHVYMQPELVRSHLRFDVERLRAASQRLFEVEDGLLRLRSALETHADRLARRATAAQSAPRSRLWIAQAQAAADLAKESTLHAITGPSRPLAIVALMAVNRWVQALQGLAGARASATVIHRHVQAGRLAHRALRTLKPGSGMRRYCGVLTSAVVVAEFVHPQDAPVIRREIEAGIARAQQGAGRSDAVVLEAVSAALRTGARLAESVADRAEPRALELAQRAESVEAEVKARLS